MRWFRAHRRSLNTGFIRIYETRRQTNLSLNDANIAMEKRECHKVTNGWGTFCDQIRISKLENRHEPLVAGWLRAT